MSNIIIMESINIIANCTGKFVIDSIGIHSIEPVAIKSAIWEGNTFIIEGYNSFNNNINIGNVTISGGGCIIINGVKYTSNNTPSVSSSNHKIFNYNWIDDNRENVTLGSINLSGSCSFQINIPLSNNCKMESSGSSNIAISGHNQSTKLTINASGTTNIDGNSKISSLILNSSGVSNICGFIVSDNIVIKASGVGNIHIYRCDTCKVNKIISGCVNARILQI